MRRLNLRRVQPPAAKIFRLLPEGRERGRALVSMATQLYERLQRGEPINTDHPAGWKNWNLARSLLDLGFRIDVMPSDPGMRVADKSFDVTLDVRSNLEYLHENLQQCGVRIYFPQFGHWALNNGRQLERHVNLLLRRGVSILPYRLIQPTNSVEVADHILSPGGTFSASAFQHSKAKYHQIQQAPPNARIQFIDREYSVERFHFVWIGGAGAVHKGLDICLEAFARLPSLHLHICGAVSREKSFTEAYHGELELLDNIHYHGWTDTTSEQWMSIVRSAGFVLLHSASEVAATSPVAGMFTGLIPVVNPGADQDYPDCSLVIPGNTVDELVDHLKEISGMQAPDLRARSRIAFEQASSRSTQDNFMFSLRRSFCDALGLEAPSKWNLDDRPGTRPKSMPKIIEVTREYL